MNKGESRDGKGSAPEANREDAESVKKGQTESTDGVTKAAFAEATAHVLHKNAELYRRLASRD
jgi:hypothetical protein